MPVAAADALKFTLEVTRGGETTLQAHWYAPSMVDGFRAAVELGVEIPLETPGWRMRRVHFHSKRGKGSRASCLAFIDRLHPGQGDVEELKDLVRELVLETGHE